MRRARLLLFPLIFPVAVLDVYKLIREPVLQALTEKGLVKIEGRENGEK